MNSLVINWFKMLPKILVMPIVLLLIATPVLAKGIQKNETVRAAAQSTSTVLEIDPFSAPSGWTVRIPLAEGDYKGTALYLEKDTIVTIALQLDQKVYTTIGYIDSTDKATVFYSKKNANGKATEHVATVSIPSAGYYTFYIQNVSSERISVNGTLQYEEEELDDTTKPINLDGVSISASGLKIPESILEKDTVLVYQNKNGSPFTINKDEIICIELSTSEVTELELGYINSDNEMKRLSLCTTNTPIAKISMPVEGAYKFYVKNVDSGSVVINKGLLNAKN